MYSSSLILKHHLDILRRLNSKQGLRLIKHLQGTLSDLTGLLKITSEETHSATASSDFKSNERPSGGVESPGLNSQITLRVEIQINSHFKLLLENRPNFLGRTVNFLACLTAVLNGCSTSIRHTEIIQRRKLLKLVATHTSTDVVILLRLTVLTQTR